MVEYLLDNHVATDVKDSDEWQPVHAAACWGHVSIVSLYTFSDWVTIFNYRSDLWVFIFLSKLVPFIFCKIGLLFDKTFLQQTPRMEY